MERREAILIHEDGEIEHIPVPIRYPGVNKALGVQWIEAVYAGGHTFYLDEEGKLNGRPQNILAEALYRGLGGSLRGDDFLVGPVIILGPPDAHGDDTDVSQELVELINGLAKDMHDLLAEDEK